MKFFIKFHENKYRLCKLRDIKDSGLSTKLLFPPNITNEENLYLPRNLNIRCNTGKLVRLNSLKC